MTQTFRRCLELLGTGRKLRWVVIVLLALAAAGLEVLGALVLVWLLTVVTTATSGYDIPLLGDLRELLPGVDELVLAAIVGGLVAGVFLLRSAVVLGQSYVQYRVAENAGARLAGRLLGGYLAMPHEFHLQRNSAELVRNSYDTVQQFVREALLPFVKLFSHSLIMLGLIGVLLWASPLATLLAVGTLGPLTWLLLRVVHPRVKRMGEVSQAASKSSLQTLNESLAGWRDITVLGRRAFFVQAFQADRDRLARARYLRFTARELPRSVMELALVLFILGFLGVSMAVGGGALAALPTLGLFGYAAVRLQPSLNEMLVSMNALKFVGPGIDYLYDDISQFPEEAAESAAARDDGVHPLPLRRELRVEGVTARYPAASADALRDVSLSIRAGEFFGIVGPTGSGKSTLVDVLLGLHAPASGRVLVDGVDLATDTAGWHAGLGVVHQEIFLADTTVRRNIALGTDNEQIDESRVREAVELAQLAPFLRSLPDGLDTVIGERGVNLSGGQRQRLAIARALYRRPGVIFFDEGTSALDTITEEQLMSGLAALRGERTVIVVAHRLSTVRQCDRVALIDDGRVREVAPFDELVERHPDLLRAGA